MESKIDWSKAPADATHYQAATHGVFECWLKPGHAVRVSRGEPDWREDDHADDLIATSAIKRPWSGEGLPPVGVVCDVFNRELSNPEWEKCTILFAGNHRFLYDSESCAERCGYIENLEFRPARTPEQFAADERERFAQELVAAMGKGGGPNALYQARRMYDLGYRKP